MILSATILLSFPLMPPANAFDFDVPGNQCLKEIKLIVTNKVFDPQTNPPSYARLKQACDGTKFVDESVPQYDFLKALAIGLDTAQSAVVSAYSSGSTAPVPPDPLSLAATMNGVFSLSLFQTKPTFPQSPFSLVLFTAAANFIVGSYLV